MTAHPPGYGNITRHLPRCAQSIATCDLLDLDSLRAVLPQDFIKLYELLLPVSASSVQQASDKKST